MFTVYNITFNKGDKLMDLNELWTRSLIILEPEFSKVIFESTISKLVPFSFNNNHLILKAEEAFYKDVINSRYLPILESGVSKVYKSKVTIEVYDKEDIENYPNNENHFSETIVETPTSMYSGYSFDNFISGKSSDLAYNAAMAVAQKPGEAYNPLFIVGDVGLGKTHLMYAILNYIKSRSPEKKVLYCTSEEFTNEFLTAIKDGKNVAFRDKYRQIDALLIDDIQFLIGKVSTQEEFFHTFNALHSAKKQIIISSDQLPEKLNQLENRLISRFAQGLTVDIYAPDFETRCAILNKKAMVKGFEIPKDVTSFIAQNIDSNIRELEGALNRVSSYSELTNNPITLELTKIALEETLKNRGKQEISTPLILDITASYFGMSIDDIISKKRTANVALARHIAMYLANKHTDNTLVTIGKVHFNGRDHSTVSHSCRLIEKKIQEKAEIKKYIMDLEEKIKN